MNAELLTLLKQIQVNADKYRNDLSRTREDRMEAVRVGAIVKELLAGHIPNSWHRFTDNPEI